MKGRKPDFLIIGAMKCGTTSLHDYLGKHPEIFTTTPKEIHFFTENKFDEDKIEEYYINFKSEKKIVGTSPQNYTKYHKPEFSGVAARLKHYLPNVKLIYLVRDPLKRIVSHYNESQESGSSPSVGLNETLFRDNNHHYIRTSEYYNQLSQYLPYFKKSQILILSLEDLQSNRLQVLNKVFNFLGVEELDNFSLFDYSLNKSGDKRRNSMFWSFIYGFYQYLPTAFKQLKLLQGIKKNKFLNKLTKTHIKKEELSEDAVNMLTKRLHSDANKLREWAGESFEEWTV